MKKKIVESSVFTKLSSLTVQHGNKMKHIGAVEYQPNPKNVSTAMIKGFKKITGKKASHA